jgi:hypothetical protein
MTENVVYSYAPEDNPVIRYHSMPSSCAGRADTLAQARSSFRSDLSGLLNVGRRDLPPVIEHVETVVHGMWVREKVGAVHRDHRADRMLLQTLLAGGAAQGELRDYLGKAAQDGATPVVVLAEPSDTVVSVLDQMAPSDTVVVAYCDPLHDVGWTAIHGPDAVGAAGTPRVAIDQQLCRLPVIALARRYPRMRLETLPRAC